MAGERIAIVAAAATTPVGGSLAETAAALRAGLRRQVACAWRDARGEPIVAARVELSPAGAGSPRARRIAALLAPTVGRLSAGSPEPAPLFLGLPDGIDARALGFEATRVSRGGRAAALAALAAATTAIANGACARAIVAGADSLIDQRLLAELDRDGRLRSPANRDGLTPGEGAAALLLERAPLRGVAIKHVAMGVEGRRPGDGLAAAAGEALAASDGPASVAWSTMTGESRWTREWCVMALRNADRLAEDLDLRHPAEACGDPGAASGAVALALAAHDLARGERSGPALVLASADGPERAAALLEAA